MGVKAQRVLFWSPRILGVLFAIFISMFSLDVFSQGYGLWGTVGALMLHLVPTYVVVITLVLSWRWEWIGATVFNALAVLYVIWARGQVQLLACLSVSGPLALAGVLFGFNWVFRARLRDSPPP